MFRSKFFACALALLLAVLTRSGWGQRVVFPSPIAETTTQYNAPAAGSTFVNPGSPPTYTPPAYAPPPTSYPAPGAVVQPPATFGGSIAPPPMWDPYQSPGDQVPSVQPYYGAPAAPAQPPSLFPGGPAGAFNPGGYAYSRPDGSVGQWPRLFQDIRGEYTWLVGGSGSEDLGISTFAASATVQFPFFYNQAPLLITPGFALNLWQGPKSSGPGTPDLPAQTYDAYIDAGWNPTVTPWLSADLNFRVGLYTDFAHTTNDSVRIQGRGLGILTFTPNVQVAMGVVYLNRLRIKLLPAGGVIWTPNEDTRLEILFPYPKLARRLTTIGTTEWWWYVAGEYGGGVWTVERDYDVSDNIEYDDLRIIGGLEWKTLSRARGHIEAGYVFNRELYFDQSKSPPSFDPSDTFMLRAGLIY